MSGGRFAKGLPEYVYFIGDDNDWVSGPYVNPKRGYTCRKFKLVEVENIKEPKKKKKMLKEDELYDEFLDNGFEKDFKFLGNDGKTYLFNVDMFDMLCTEYGEPSITEIMQSGVEEMLDKELCTLVK